MDSFIKFRTLCEKWIGNEDIVITIENTDGFRGYERKAMEYLLESPKFDLTWNIGRSKAIGETDVPFLMEYSHKLRHFHIHDGITKNKEQPGSNYLAFRDGEIDIKERLLIANTQNARCIMETKNHYSLRKICRIYKSIRKLHNGTVFYLKHDIQPSPLLCYIKLNECICQHSYHSV